MKMKSLIPLFVAALLFSSASAALALNIVVNSDGQMVFSDMGVLGDTTETKSTTETEIKQTIEPYTGKTVEIIPSEKTLHVTLKGKDSKNLLKNVNVTDTKRLHMEIPVNLRNQTKIASGSADRHGNKIYMEQLQVEKQNRGNETLKVQNTYNDDGQLGLELESRKIRAKLHGAQFTYDPTTNAVTLTTPSGNIHILKHLPDQALEQMQKLTTDVKIASDSADLTITTNASGSATYTTQVKKTKKFLGFIPRQVDTNVSLDDATGAVTETEQQPVSFIDRLLNTLSF